MKRSALSLTAVMTFVVSCSSSQEANELSECNPASRTLTDSLPQNDPTLVNATTLSLHVRGMSCPKCVTNAEIQLERLPGVSNASLNLGDGTFRIQVKPGAPLTRGNLARAIWVAGFTLVEIEELS